MPVADSTTSNARELRGLQIAASQKIRRTDKAWYVPASQGGHHYSVNLDGDSPRCTCPDYELRRQRCKHIYAVEYTLKKETNPNGTVTVTETKKVTYKQNWRPYNAAKTEEKARFMALLADLCGGVPKPKRAPGPGRSCLPFSDMVFASAFKTYVGFSSRRFTTDLPVVCCARLGPVRARQNDAPWHLSGRFYRPPRPVHAGRSTPFDQPFPLPTNHR